MIQNHYIYKKLIKKLIKNIKNSYLFFIRNRFKVIYTIMIRRICK